MSDHKGDGRPPAWTAGRRITEQESYTPHPLERQGERMAWSLAVALIALTAYLRIQMDTWAAALLLLTVLFLAAALLISFGNWMERGTSIEATVSGVRYKNPLRELDIRWEEIAAVHIDPRGHGWRVLVESVKDVFSFQTGTTLAPGFGRSIQTGVMGGESLVAGMIGMAGLGSVEPIGDGWVFKPGESTGA